MDEVRLGLIGVGRWAERYAETAKLLTSPRARFTAYARRKREDVSWLPDARRVDDVAELLGSGIVDGVVVACGPGPAMSHVKTALEAGVPVLVEKPVTLFAQEALELQVLAADGPTRGLPWARVGHVHLHAPAYVKLLVLVWMNLHQNKDEVVRVTSWGGGYGPWRSYPALWDYGPHEVSMVLNLMRSLNCGTFFEVGDVERELLLEGERWSWHGRSGRTEFFCAISNVSPRKVRRFQVDTKAGRSFVYDDREPASSKLTVDQVPIPLEDERGALTVMLENFVREIAAGRRPWDHMRDVELAVRVTQVLAQVERAAALE